MIKKDSQKGNYLTNALKENSIYNIAKDSLELGIDLFLESGILKDLPVINTISNIVNISGSTRDQILANKILLFIHKLSEISIEEREKMLNRLNEDDKYAGRVGSSLIETLDRLETEKKPELAAKCFIAFSKEKITYEELRRLLVVIERIPTFDLDKIEEFSSTSLNYTLANESLLLSFVNAGLGVNNGAMDGGSIIPTKLCTLFSEIIFKSGS